MGVKMPRADIIAAWRDGYAHGVKDATEAAAGGQPKAPDERKVIEIREYQTRRWLRDH